VVESVTVTLFPVCFLAVLFGGGALLRRRNIDMDGEPPIDRRLFYASKYSILLVWAAMVASAWGVNLSFIKWPGIVKWSSLALWAFGFALLLIGRLGLGESFRIGSPRESTSLRVGGLFAVSRNPMYLGLYATLIAAALYTLNPAVFVVAALVVGVHHRIVLAEEEYLRRMFGDEYADYCRHVRRYL
jgi:protein-S-isoprenylcysteine O-methyltransferase Ste14